MIDIEGILEEVVVKVMGHASRKNAFWLISMDGDCTCVFLVSSVSASLAFKVTRISYISVFVSNR
jgi:hypothetical protein